MKLETLKAEIQRLVPELLEIKFGCKIKLPVGSEHRVINDTGDLVVAYGDENAFKYKKDYVQIIGLPITLFTIWKAWQRLSDENPEKRCPYPILGILEGGCILNEGKKGGTYEEIGLKWNLENDNLEAQSEEVIEYFYNIFFPNYETPNT